MTSSMTSSSSISSPTSSTAFSAVIFACDSSRLRALIGTPSPSPYSPRLPLLFPSSSPLNPTSRPPYHLAGVRLSRRRVSSNPATTVSPRHQYLVSSTPLSIAHLTDVFHDFFAQLFSERELDRIWSPPRTTPASPPHCSRTRTTTPPRHQLRLIALHPDDPSPSLEHHRSDGNIHSRAAGRRPSHLWRPTTLGMNPSFSAIRSCTDGHD